MTCPQCGSEVLKARISPDVWRTLEAEPSADGEWATWTVREGLNWITRARREAAGDRLNGEHLRRLHACRPQQQLELGSVA